MSDEIIMVPKPKKKAKAADGENIPTKNGGKLLPKKVYAPSDKRGDQYAYEVWTEAWKNREAVALEAYHGDKEKAATLLGICERISSGERWAVALASARMSWNDFNHGYLTGNKKAKVLQFACGELCRSARKLHLEEEAYRRAVDGVDEPVYSASGKLAGYRKRYSDILLTLLLRAYNPDRFGEKSQGGGGMVLNVNLGLRTPDKPAIEVVATEVASPVIEDEET